MKLLNVPYVKQKTEYTCGIACIQMVLRYYGIKKSDQEIIDASGVTRAYIKIDGLPTRALVRVLKNFGIELSARKNSNLALLTRMAGKQPIIVGYIEKQDDDGHYAVLVGIEGDAVVMNDPMHGKMYQMAISEFTKRWKSKYENAPRWMCVITSKK